MSDEVAAAVARQHRYELLTWPEINVAAAMNKVVILPVGSTEQHGEHLPLDVDARLPGALADAAGRRSPEDMLVLPTLAYGYCHHVMDFPGTINVEPSTFVRLLLDIGKSVAYHGFKRIIMLNGHGSNHPLMEQAGRQVCVQTDALCLTLSWWQLAGRFWNEEVRSSGPGGCSHACELETSVYMHVNGEQVRTDQVRGRPAGYMDLPGADRWHYGDLTMSRGPATLIEWTSTYSENGVMGRPDLATPEKGRRVFEHTVGELMEMVRWFRQRPAPPRRNLHTTAPTFDPGFGWGK